VKINVDGYSKGNLGVAGAGGVIRDAIGRWIVGFALNIRICTSGVLNCGQLPMV